MATKMIAITAATVLVALVSASEPSVARAAPSIGGSTQGTELVTPNECASACSDCQKPCSEKPAGSARTDCERACIASAAGCCVAAGKKPPSGLLCVCGM